MLRSGLQDLHFPARWKSALWFYPLYKRECLGVWRLAQRVH